MTFIASVIAKNGIVVLADSLTTYSASMISIDDILDKFATDDTISKEELLKLVRNTPLYSESHTDKLFELDNHTVLTTAGAATINELVIKKLIDKFKENYISESTVAEKLNSLISFLNIQSKEHITKKKTIGQTFFILSCYNLPEDKYEIYQIDIAHTKEEDLIANIDHVFITSQSLTEEKVVCVGQTRLTNKLLLGASLDIRKIIETSVQCVVNSNLFANLEQVQKEGIIQQAVNQITNFDNIKDYIAQQKELFHIRELEIQEAIDFVCLLYKMVVEFQKYTYKFPDVGGSVKIGILQKDNFKIISGDEIKIPDYI